jgi:hypothetical protein
VRDDLQVRQCARRGFNCHSRSRFWQATANASGAKRVKRALLYYRPASNRRGVEGKILHRKLSARSFGDDLQACGS